MDLAALEKERTHEIWQELDDGFGTVHFSVTLCTVRNSADSFNSQLADGVVKAKHVSQYLSFSVKILECGDVLSSSNMESLLVTQSRI